MPVRAALHISITLDDRAASARTHLSLCADAIQRIIESQDWNEDAREALMHLKQARLDLVYDRRVVTGTTP